MNTPPAELDRWIVSRRPSKNAVDPWRPYHFLVEPERSPNGTIEDVGTIFLTNRECPFRCLMCDLWKNTTDERTPDGAILAQIDWALARMPPLRRLKLYNSGNFFDPQAVPSSELPAIAARLSSLETLIVECHPRMIGKSCFEFNDLLQPALEVAIGLETVHPEVLPRLNKRMSLADFDSAVGQLKEHGISIRAFVLVRPPYLTEAEGLHWGKRSLDHAFAVGVECCVLIPTRSGNGAMDELVKIGAFEPPTIRSLELATEHGIRLAAGRTFADLWDVGRFANCPSCAPGRIERLSTMNQKQQIPPSICCSACDSANCG